MKLIEIKEDLFFENPIHKLQTTEKIQKQISNIDALQIHALASKISETVLSRSGNITRLISWIKLIKEGQNSKEELIGMGMEMSKNYPSSEKFSKKDEIKLFHSFHQNLQSNLRHAFSNPISFLDHGMRLQITLEDDSPSEFLLGVAKNTTVDLSLFQFPSKYLLKLKLDWKLTKEQSELIFALSEFTDGTNFSEKKFSLKEIEQKLTSSL